MSYRADFDFVFVVLTYRNTVDLDSFIKYTRERVNDAYKIIVVNSFFDHESLDRLREIAVTNNCDFLNTENKGYGYGNNRGIDFARSHYKFKFLIVSNPDIEIQYMPTIDSLEEYSRCIIAPTIKTLTGKNQNPYYPYLHRIC